MVKFQIYVELHFSNFYLMMEGGPQVISTIKVWALSQGLKFLKVYYLPWAFDYFIPLAQRTFEQAPVRIPYSTITQ